MPRQDNQDLDLYVARVRAGTQPLLDDAAYAAYRLRVLSAFADAHPDRAAALLGVTAVNKLTEDKAKRKGA